MKVKQSDVVKMLVECGVQTAGDWPAERIQKRLDTLPKLVKGDEWKEPKTADSKTLLKKILKSLENEVEIEIIPTEKEKEAPKAAAKASSKTEAPASKAKAPAKASKVKPDDDDDDDDDEDEEDEEEDEEEEEDEDEEDEEDEDDEEEEASSKKSSKSNGEAKADTKGKTKGSKEGEKKEKRKGFGEGVGITKTIKDLVMKASKSNPITKDQIVSALKEKFPDRNEAGLMKTTQGMVSYFLRREPHNLDIQLAGRNKGYYVPKTKAESEDE